MNDEILKEIEKLEELEKYEEIINIIENLQAEQLNTEIIEELARAYANIQKYEKAIEILKSIEYEGKNSVDWNYTIGYSYYYSKDYKNSEKYFLRALELDETEDNIKNALLNVYLELSGQTINESIENKDKAIEYALKSEKYIITNDDKVKVNSHLAWIYEEIEDFDTAEKFLKNTIDLGRDDIPVNSELGYCLEQLTRFEEALEYYKKAMKLGRKDQWIYSRIGYICCYLKKYEESLEANLKAYELGENNILINSELGYSLGELQRFEEAITYYLKARELGR
ncbi:MAG: tetratricopeptide repeat protein, partial [Fusobacterium nucleatum]|nr:tetratricopeptide repeat protein [Fusobacterium nucleatum]